MKRKYIAKTAALFTICLSFTICHAGEVPDVTNRAVVEAFVDGVVKPTMTAHHSLSGVVSVMKNGRMIFSKGYGYQDVEKRIPVDPDTTLFRPGSISKLFTWVSVMQLVEQGRLDLDVDVNQYLKTFQIADTWPGQPVTLRHIMTHTAGFEDGGLGYLILDDATRIMPLAQSMAKYQPVRINPPGQHTGYSNWATALAGLIVSNVSGMPFNDYVEQNIFSVLGMTSSTFREPLPPELEKNMAKAYGFNAGKYVDKNYEIISNFGPAGSLAATSKDMSLFARALLNGGAFDGKRVLKPETLQQMIDEGFSHDDRVRGTGLGFLKRRYGPDALENFGHDGGTTIFVSHFGLSLKENMMLFSSFSGPGGGHTHRAFVKAFYDEFFPRDVPVVTPPADFADRAQKYAGTYNSWRNNFTRIEAIMRVLGGMTVTPMPDNSLLIGEKRYIETDHNLFREADGYDRIAFQEDEDGEITGFVIDGTGVMQFYKAPFYETALFLGMATGLSLIVFIGVLLRLAYQRARYKALAKPEKNAFRASVLVAVLNLLFLVFVGTGISGGLQALTYNLPFLLKFSLVFSTLATLAAFYHLYYSVRIWRQGLLDGVFARIRYNMISICALFMAWFYYYYNLVGLNYYS